MTHGRIGLLVSALVFCLLAACGGSGDSSPSVTVLPEGLSISAEATAEAGNPISFNNSAAPLGGLKFAWAFGDGATSTEAAPQHTFTKGGDFEVRLTVTNEAGASKQTSFHVSVNNRANVRGLACTGLADTGWCWQRPKPSGTAQHDLFFLDAKTAWSVGDFGQILKTSDGGLSWVKQYSGLSTPLWSVRFVDANRGWAIGAYGAVLQTSDGGANWVLQAAALMPGSSARLYVIDANTVVIDDDNGRIRVTNDAGNTWVVRMFYVTAVGSDSTLWKVVDGKLMKSVDLGKTAHEVFAAEAGNGSVQLFDRQGVVISTVRSTYDASTNRPRFSLTLDRSTNNGTSWESFDAQGLPDDFLQLDQVSFVDALRGLLRTNNDRVYRTSDGGHNWVLVQSPANSAPGLDYFRILPNNGVLRGSYSFSRDNREYSVSEDGGLAWRSFKQPSRNSPCEVLRRIDSATWLCRRSGGEQYLSGDDMASWRPLLGVDPPSVPWPIQAIWYFDANRGLALNVAGELLQTSNGGGEWAVKLNGLTQDGYYGRTRIQFASTTKGWLLSFDGKLRRSLDGGATWAVPWTGVAPITQFHFVDESTGFAISREASERDGDTTKPVLLVSSDGGQSWSRRADFFEDIYSLNFFNATRGVAVGGGGRILTTADGGFTWVSRFSGTSDALQKVVFSEADTVWAVGDLNSLLRSTDGGVRWTAVPLGIGANLRDIQFVDARHGWAVGGSGVILRTQDGGATWQPQFSATHDTLNQVFFVDSRTGWATGESGSILATGTGGN